MFYLKWLLHVLISDTTLTSISFFFCLHLQHMEFPRLGVESELQLLAYAIATATPDPSCVCDLHHSSWQHWILNLLSKARDQTWILMDTTWVCYRWPADPLRELPSPLLDSSCLNWWHCCPYFSQTRGGCFLSFLSSSGPSLSFYLGICFCILWFIRLHICPFIQQIFFSTGLWTSYIACQTLHWICRTW